MPLRSGYSALILFALALFATTVEISAFTRATPRLSTTATTSPLHAHDYARLKFNPSFRQINTALRESSGDSEASRVLITPPPQADSPGQDLITKFKNLLSGNGFGNAKLSKESLAKLGLNALLAYGFVSNFSYITCVIISWIAHGKATGLSPLAPGQWKKFLVIYAGFFAANNILRPLRFTLSLVITPAFDRIIDAIQKKTKLNRSVSTGITVFLVNVCGTLSYLFGGLFVATTIARVPLFK
jgi:hypothetical protein